MQKIRSQTRLAICTLASPQIPILLALIFFLNFSLVCAAAVIKVPENYSTIQSAIDAASDGDEIIVSPGTYYENIHFNGKNIILRSTDPTSPTVVASTIIDGHRAVSVVTFSGTELTACLLSGFTVTNGLNSEGGGIYGNGTMATIQYNNIRENTAYGSGVNGYGGGVYLCHGTIQNNIISRNSAGGYYSFGGGLHRCHGTIQNNTISGNSAIDGGGLSECRGTIRNNTISSNLAYWYGGGIFGCNGTIQNNIIADNWAGLSGGGLDVCNGTIQNNTIYGNSASSGGGLYKCKGLIINCIIWANSAYTANQLYECSEAFYSCIQDWGGVSRGNISADPCFVDQANGNLHLLPGSPCIDAGNKYYLFGEYITDMDGECRLAGSSVDIGSDEFSSSLDSDGDLLSDINEEDQATNPNNPDTDGDGLIDGIEVLRGTPPAFYNIPPGIWIPAQYFSIQQGLFFAFSSEAVTLSPGTYKENLHFLGKDIILQSIDFLDDDVVSSTIVDGDGSFSVMFFEGTENETCVVRGLTIRNGSSCFGGGICGNGTHATFERINIFSNSAEYGGAFCDCDGTVQNNIISGNTAHYGGALGSCDGSVRNNSIFNNSAYFGGGLWWCKATIMENTISANSAEDYGGGLAYCNGTIQNNIISINSADNGGALFGCHGTIQNNTISANSAVYGGGFGSCDGIIQNNNIYGNSAVYGGALRSCDGAIQSNNIYGNSADHGGGLNYCNGAIRNCIVWENSATTGTQLSNCRLPSYSCIQDWTGNGSENISDDPQFVDPANGDFHLLSTSPCIDAGGYIDNLSQDIEGDPRPWDGTSEPRGDGSDFDIGADEFIGALNYEFTASEEGWTSSTAVVFSEPQCLFEPGSLKLISQNNTNTFGFWNSPENALPANEHYLYRARFTVSTDVAQPELVPQIRLRVNSRNFQQADCLMIDSNGDGAASPTAAGTTYDLYFIPPANVGYCMLAFDLLNFNPYDAARAELALESVLVDRFALDTLDDSTTTCWTYDFETGQEFWIPGDGTYAFTDPEFFWAEGALYLQSMTNTNTFGFWHNDPIDIIIEADRLYRGTFEVRTDETDRSRVPQMRLRFNTANMQAARTLEISSIGDGANSPGTTNTTYDRLYFLPPANCVGKGLIVSFDILNFSPDDAPDGTLILDSVTVESLVLTVLP